jgi:ribosome-associated protein
VDSSGNSNNDSPTGISAKRAGKAPPAKAAAATEKQPAKPDLKKLLEQCEVETFRSSGPGGQHRNRRESAVRLIHRRTGTVATATERRSQHQNKQVALERLDARLKARRKKKKPRVATRPSKAAKKRRLEDKKKTSRKKASRGKVPRED